jgi:hypothetical protein
MRNPCATSEAGEDEQLLIQETHAPTLDSVRVAYRGEGR